MKSGTAKIGDMVKIQDNYPEDAAPYDTRSHGGLRGECGRVVGLAFATGWLGVVIPSLKVGHEAGRIYKPGLIDGWWIEEKYLEKVAEALPSLVHSSLFPTEAKARKDVPLASGVLDYFTSALIEVAKVSFEGNKQHNPGEPLHWARGKSMDQADTMLRHFVERGTMDSDGIRHSAKMAWRALAILQLEMEAEGAPVARGAK